MPRTDIHRPSVIKVDEYEYVGQEYIKIECPGDCIVLMQMREHIQRHMARTGGTYSTHAHGGNCHICGNVNAMYTILFRHLPTNVYVRAGVECADKLGWGGDDSFRRNVEDYRKNVAGKKKAQTILYDMSASLAWDIYLKPFDAKTRDEAKITDMVSNLVKYGSFVSEKQQAFLGQLVARQVTPVHGPSKPTQDERATQWAAEKEAASPCPSGRVTVTGNVLKVDHRENAYGPVTKMLVKAEAGYMVWVTAPSAFAIEKGDKITFAATLEPSQDDPKFGFGKRPVMKNTAPVPVQ
jgi:hypothetical protein